MDSSVLFCTGNSLFALETQAVVVKKAAILLGAGSNRIITLDLPNYNKINRGIVTDALHMPGAYKFFAMQGF